MLMNSLNYLDRNTYNFAKSKFFNGTNYLSIVRKISNMKKY